MHWHFGRCGGTSQPIMRCRCAPAQLDTPEVKMGDAQPRHAFPLGEGWSEGKLFFVSGSHTGLVLSTLPVRRLSSTSLLVRSSCTPPHPMAFHSRHSHRAPLIYSRGHPRLVFGGVTFCCGVWCAVLWCGVPLMKSCLLMHMCV